MTARIAPLLLGMLLGAGGCSNNADPTPIDPANARILPAADARTLLHEAVEIISTRAMGRQRVDWARAEAELAADLPPGSAPRAAHGAIVRAVARLDDGHARFIPPPEAPATPAPAAAEPTRVDHTDAPARRIPDAPEGAMLEGRIACIVIPGCPHADANRLRPWARSLSEQVRTLSGHDPVGWIIDLRLNGGGNLWPMLLGLRGILPDGVCLSSLDDSSVVNRFGVSARSGAWIDWGSGPETQLDWAADPPPEPVVPGRDCIAVLLGPWTMSSGEALAIALRSGGARTFGEPTAGLTTVTNTFRLSDGSTLILPVARMGDAHGRPVTGRLMPDQPEPFGDWPTRDDSAARAAAAWLKSRAGRRGVSD